MAYEKMNWKDRIVERPNTFRAQNNPDGTVTQIPEPGTIIQAGTPLSATILNQREEKIKEEFDNISSQLAENANQIISNTANISNHSGQIASLSSGAPKAVSLVSQMIDTTKNYVYTGSEGGYIAGNWYYWNGSAWTSGGVYQSSGIADGSITYEKLSFNKLTKNKLKITPIIQYGITTSNDPETGMTTINGTKSGDSRIIIASFTVDDSGDYILSYKSGNANTKPTMYIYSGATQIATWKRDSATVTANLTSGVTYTLEIYIASGTVVDYILYLQLEYGTVATDFTPCRHRLKYSDYITPENGSDILPKSFDYKHMKFMDSGKNLLLIDNSVIQGITITNDKLTGKTTLVGTKASGTTRFVISTFIAKKTGTHTLSFVGTTKPSMYIYSGATQVVTWESRNATKTVDLVAGTEYTLEVYVPVGDTINYELYLQLEYGTLTNFTPYKYRLKYSDYITPEDIPIETYPLEGKYLSILGCSIDTYSGYIPSGNASYYSDVNLGSVEYTWWKRLINKTKMTLLVNNSWSGASCATLGTSSGLQKSGVVRCLNLDDGVHTPDIIIIGAMLLNDFGQAVPIGEYDDTTMLPSITDTITETTPATLTFKSAFATICKRLIQKYPQAKIYAMNAYNYHRVGNESNCIPTISGNTIRDYNVALAEVAEYFGVELIRLNDSGITFGNSQGITVDSLLHPNAVGQKMLYAQVMTNFEKYKY